MPEKTANPSKQPESEKKSDAAKLPNAPPKQEKPPDQAAVKITAPAPAGKTPAAPEIAAEKPAPAQPKAAEHKSPPSAEEQKTAPAPAKPTEKAPDAQKPESKAPAKPPALETAAAPKPSAPTAPTDKGTAANTAPKPTLNKPVSQPAQKAEPSAKIMLGGKPHDPITPPKTADPLHDPGESKGVRVTQIFENRLDYPDEKALNSLPIPKEGEGFSMRLHPAYFYQFLDHPFTVNREVKDYIELYESIRDNGINEPVKARPREKGGLELISGHRRHDIAKRLNYPVPVIIAQVDDDTARVEVVDGNLHRMDIPTSELARAAKMKMEALARKAGRRSKMEILTNPEPQKRTDQIVAEDSHRTPRERRRFLRRWRDRGL